MNIRKAVKSGCWSFLSVFETDRDIYVSSSYSESLPDAIRDAMLAGLPLVVSNVGGTKDLVVERKNGFLFEPGDIGKFVELVKELISDSHKRKRMGENSKKIIESKFSTKSYAKKFEKMTYELFI